MWKPLIKSMLSQFGCKLERLRPPPLDPDSRAAAELPVEECYAHFKSDCPIFQPWRGYGKFRAAYAGVPERTLVSADRCYLLWKMAHHAKQLPGDFIECGVYRGGTALLLSRVLNTDDHRKLWAFDSFEGLPNAVPTKGDFYQSGTFSDTSFEAVSGLLKPFAGSVELKKGWMPSTFAGLDHLRFSLAHVDVDLYEPALDCCRFVWPRLNSGGVILFDDYGFPACRGERTAVDEFFAEMDCPVVTLPTGQGLVIKV